MPELPDITVYIEALEARILDEELSGARVASPFVLRSVDPPISTLVGKKVQAVRRLGKQIVLQFEGDLFLVIHLMIAGRLQWKTREAPLSKSKTTLAALDFFSGTLVLTEAGSKKRASLHVVCGPERLQDFSRGGLEILDAGVEDFKRVAQRENHTLKRFLTDPRLLSGIGNAYSDEILHRARLSPMKLTSRLSDLEIRQLYDAARETLSAWTRLLRDQTGDGFPSRVTAFRPEMAVHGRFGEPCPICGSPVQRIAYAENECNYCATCQTEGRLLADRAMSRLLNEDWPRSLDELEQHFESRRK